MHRESIRLACVQRVEECYTHSHGPRASRKPLVLALTAALGLPALPGVSIAACFISAPGEVTCNGDLLPGVVSGVTQLTDGQTLNSAIWPVLTVGNLSRPLITLSLAAPLIRFGPDNPVNLNVPGRDLAFTFSGPATAPGFQFALIAGGDNVGGIEVRAVSGDGSKGNDASCGIPGYSADYGKAGAPGPTVTLTSGAAIKTLGASAVALRGSSKGGNGGSGGDSCISHSTGASGAGAVGGTVNVETTTGSVLVTDGAQSHAVFAFSEGGAADAERRVPEPAATEPVEASAATAAWSRYAEWRRSRPRVPRHTASMRSAKVATVVTAATAARAEAPAKWAARAATCP
jgi:hypothetical protein